ncbi:FadR/GntR family transcriptional regulator [Loktanella salsilacus]|uniref:FadR/GntR family transcriptional regulator n=1 Tax=Loktanella salsilacus TaxID=195913 RepID=UPI003736E3C4
MPDVVRALAGDILSGRFVPGAMLPREPDLCVQYEVSRTVIREALKVLDAKGLVVTRSRVGTQVADPDDWNILDPQLIEWHPKGALDKRIFDAILETRRGIEPLAAEFAAERASLAELAAIEEALHGMEAAGNDIQKFARADINFHQALYAASRNPIFRQIGKLIDAALTFAFQETAALSSDERAKATRVHAALVDALRVRDTKAARLASEAIIDLATHDMAKALKIDVF